MPKYQTQGFTNLNRQLGETNKDWLERVTIELAASPDDIFKLLKKNKKQAEKLLKSSWLEIKKIFTDHATTNI